MHTKEFEINRIDDYSVLITKRTYGCVCAFLEDEETKLKDGFNDVSPWHKDFGLCFFRRYELFEYPYTYGLKLMSRRLVAN